MDVQEKAQSPSANNENTNSLIDKYKGILQTEPNNITALSNLGVCYASINKFDEAEKSFNKILEIDPKNLDGLNNLGVVYTQIGKIDDAIAKLEIAVKLKPDNAKLWSNLGEAYRRLGNYHQANVCRMRAIQLIEKK
ncbi:MAG: tetratricopeptide repeat protein [Promethearchaeota archaeon]